MTAKALFNQQRDTHIHSRVRLTKLKTIVAEFADSLRYSALR